MSAQDSEQAALRKQCQTCLDIFVNRLISKILLWRHKASVFLNKERKNPTTFKQIACNEYSRKDQGPRLV